LKWAGDSHIKRESIRRLSFFVSLFPCAENRERLPAGKTGKIGKLHIRLLKSNSFYISFFLV
jgi:hypothetical protein